MTATEWVACSVVSVDPEVVHGEPVFAGTRVPVQDIIDSYYGYREDGWSDQDTVDVLLESFPTIPSADALRSALAFQLANTNWMTRAGSDDPRTAKLPA